MEDAKYLSKEDKETMEALKKELEVLKAEHKDFARNKNGLTPEQRERWRANSQRTNEVHIAIKEMRLKNIFEAGNKI
jgi:type I restriction-modification system DNA methylase subunit